MKRLMTSNTGIAAGLVAVVCVGWLFACATADRERTDFLAGILRDRAAHLRQEDTDEIARGLVRAERETEIDALLLLAVAEEESRFKTRPRSRRGALG